MSVIVASEARPAIVQASATPSSSRLLESALDGFRLAERRVCGAWQCADTFPLRGRR